MIENNHALFTTHVTKISVFSLHETYLIDNKFGSFQGIEGTGNTCCNTYHSPPHRMRHCSRECRHIYQCEQCNCRQHRRTGPSDRRERLERTRLVEGHAAIRTREQTKSQTFCVNVTKQRAWKIGCKDLRGCRQRNSRV